jgi:uncharacterized membrane protein
MDCYFHANVPSVTACHDCGNPICATCRDADGTCPSCRLAARIDAAAGKQKLTGAVGYAERNPGPPPPGPRQDVGVRPSAPAATLPVSKETVGMLALGYPLWPLAVLALLDPKRTPFVRRHALQSLALNFGVVGMWLFLSVVAHIPWLGITAWPMLLVLFPLALVADVVYGFRLWNGEDVRVPLIADWLDEREAAGAAKVSAA